MSALKVEKEQNSSEVEDYPIMMVGRLAVDNSERHRGFGTVIVEHCLRFAKDLSVTVGCKFVVVVTKKGYRESFYKHSSFTP